VEHRVDNAAIACFIDLEENREGETAKERPSVVIMDDGADQRRALDRQERHLDAPEKLAPRPRL
jgi:hypothetical protein